MKTFRIFFVSILTVFLLFNCNNNSSNDTPPIKKVNKWGTVKITTDDLTFDINEFVWSGLNQSYLWNDEVSLLDYKNTFQSEDSEVDDFLVTYDDSKKLFNNLLYNKLDRFSWIVDDYEILESLFEGEYRSTGMELGLVEIKNNEIIAVVRYVLSNSPAEIAGVVRGDIITAVNGEVLNNNNYSRLLNNNTNSATYTFSDIKDNKLSFKEDKTIQSLTLNENPVFLTSILKEGGKKIGYLMYNSFTHAYNNDLNNALGKLQTTGIDDLVLDLRYNGGGRISTAQILASSIAGEDHVGDIFAKRIYNDTITKAYIKENGEEALNSYFINTLPESREKINFLNIKRIYVLTTFSTASASELIINSLNPYMDVILIGKNTHGKNVGSVTLYDSEDFDKYSNNFNTEHRWAMQPIVVQLSNVNNKSDYANGFLVDIKVDELDYLFDKGYLPPLGNVKDPLLAEAISQITGNSALTPKQAFYDRMVNSRIAMQAEFVMSSSDFRPFSKEMYFTIKEFPFKIRKENMIRK